MLLQCQLFMHAANPFFFETLALLSWPEALLLWLHCAEHT